MLSRSVTFLVLATAVSFGACRRHKPVAAPVAAPPATTSEAPLPPPPPPPPKCESLEEHCAADASTHVPIADSGVSFVPPTGWQHAKEASGGITESGDHLAVLYYAVAVGDTPEQILAAVEAGVARLKLADVKMDAFKKRLKSPQDKMEIGGAEAKLWEIDKSKQKVDPTLDGRAGAALVVTVPVGSKLVVVVGFVVKPDAEAQVEAMLGSIKSLAAGGT